MADPGLLQLSDQSCSISPVDEGHGHPAYVAALACSTPAVDQVHGQPDFEVAACNSTGKLQIQTEDHDPLRPFVTGNCQEESYVSTIDSHPNMDLTEKHLKATDSIMLHNDVLQGEILGPVHEEHLSTITPESELNVDSCKDGFVEMSIDFCGDSGTPMRETVSSSVEETISALGLDGSSTPFLLEDGMVLQLGSSDKDVLILNFGEDSLLVDDTAEDGVPHSHNLEDSFVVRKQGHVSGGKDIDKPQCENDLEEIHSNSVSLTDSEQPKQNIFDEIEPRGDFEVEHNEASEKETQVTHVKILRRSKPCPPIPFEKCIQDAEQYICEHCSSSFQSIGCLRYHMVTIHNFKNISLHPCFHCGKELLSEKMLHHHLHTEHNVRCPLLACQVCGLELSTRLELKAHFRKHPEIHACSSCYKKFASRILLNQHIREHLSKLKPFMCFLCGATFKNKIALEVHQHRHKPQMCSEEGCCESFEDESFLILHLENEHHLSSKQMKHINEGKENTENQFDSLLTLYNKFNTQRIESILCSQNRKYMDLLNYECSDWSNKYGKPDDSDLVVNDVRSVLDDIVSTVEALCKGKKGGVEESLEEALRGPQVLYRCGICNIYCASEEDLVNHKSTHDKTLECKDCGRMFASTKQLRRHLVSHTQHSAHHTKAAVASRGGKPCLDYGKGKASSKAGRGGCTSGRLKCQLCNKPLNNKAQHNEHLAQLEKEHLHPEEAQENWQFKCNKCDRKFASQNNLNIHLSTHGDPKPVLQCNKCTKDLEKPMNTESHPASNGKEHTCSKCGKRYKSASSLVVHLKSHDEAHLSRFGCTECSLKFPYKSMLEIHRRRHTGERPYPCPKCGKKFKRMQQCRTHEKTMHGNVHKLVCLICGKSFLNKCGLTRHRLMVHEQLKRWVCGVCAQSYAYSEDLRSHLNNKHDFSLSRMEGSNKKSMHEVNVIPETPPEDVPENVVALIEKVCAEERQKLERYKNSVMMGDLTTGQPELVGQLKQAPDNSVALKDSAPSCITVPSGHIILAPKPVVQTQLLPNLPIGTKVMISQKNPQEGGEFATVTQVITAQEDGQHQSQSIMATPCAVCEVLVLGESRQQCGICGIVVCSPLHLEQHTATSHPLMFQCSICGLHYQNQEACTAHIASAHPSQLMAMQGMVLLSLPFAPPAVSDMGNVGSGVSNVSVASDPSVLAAGFGSLPPSGLQSQTEVSAGFVQPHPVMQMSQPEGAAALTLVPSSTSVDLQHPQVLNVSAPPIVPAQTINLVKNPVTPYVSSPVKVPNQTVVDQNGKPVTYMLDCTGVNEGLDKENEQSMLSDVGVLMQYSNKTDIQQVSTVQEMSTLQPKVQQVLPQTLIPQQTMLTLMPSADMTTNVPQQQMVAVHPTVLTSTDMLQTAPTTSFPMVTQQDVSTLTLSQSPVLEAGQVMMEGEPPPNVLTDVQQRSLQNSDSLNSGITIAAVAASEKQKLGEEDCPKVLSEKVDPSIKVEVVPEDRESAKKVTVEILQAESLTRTPVNSVKNTKKRKRKAGTKDKEERENIMDTVIVKTKYECSDCQKVFYNSTKLERHRKVHTGIRPHKCHLCQAAFVEKCNLKIHLLTHSQDKPHQCDHCSKTFRYVRDLSEHRRIHQGSRPCVCTHCKATFVRQRDLKRHTKEQHSNEKYECKICGATFKRKQYLDMNHMPSHHPTPDQNRHPCSHCGKIHQEAFHQRQNHSKGQNKKQPKAQQEQEPPVLTNLPEQELAPASMNVLPGAPTLDMALVTDIQQPDKAMVPQHATTLYQIQEDGTQLCQEAGLDQNSLVHMAPQQQGVADGSGVVHFEIRLEPMACLENNFST
ncbi:uncharacterized protein LOC143037529 isoform X2 [Oratosquilla oratoria]|uniref:uncharacterized protein LOC143037529 isoform X2 n=1 Tax=Oratosquilla oratoria TaxID=337810 RepID=UPI003F76F7B3